MPNRRLEENLNSFENSLENALENVKFYADSTWGSSEYQKANQVKHSTAITPPFLSHSRHVDRNY